MLLRVLLLLWLLLLLLLLVKYINYAHKVVICLAVQWVKTD